MVVRWISPKTLFLVRQCNRAMKLDCDHFLTQYTHTMFNEASFWNKELGITQRDSTKAAVNLLLSLAATKPPSRICISGKAGNEICLSSDTSFYVLFEACAPALQAFEIHSDEMSLNMLLRLETSLSALELPKLESIVLGNIGGNDTTFRYEDIWLYNLRTVSHGFLKAAPSLSKFEVKVADVLAIYSDIPLYETDACFPNIKTFYTEVHVDMFDRLYDMFPGELNTPLLRWVYLISPFLLHCSHRRIPRLWSA